jgi:hypothetical protein
MPASHCGQVQRRVRRVRSGLLPPRTDPGQGFGVAEGGNYAPQVRAELSRVMLDVTNVVDVQLAPRDLPAGNTAWTLEGLGRLAGQGFEHFLAADCDVGKGFVLAEAGAGRDFALVATAVVKITQHERVRVARRETQIDPEEGVIRDRAEREVGDLAFPMVRGTGADAVVDHAQGRLELVGENLLYVFNHGNQSHGNALSNRPPNL